MSRRIKGDVTLSLEVYTRMYDWDDDPMVLVAVGGKTAPTLELSLDDAEAFGTALLATANEQRARMRREKRTAKRKSK